MVTARGNCCVRARLQDVSGQGAVSAPGDKNDPNGSPGPGDGDEQKIPRYGQRKQGVNF